MTNKQRYQEYLRRGKNVRGTPASYAEWLAWHGVVDVEETK